LRKINGSSLAFLALPILFSGCMQEKVSTIIPPKSTGNTVIINSSEKILPVKSNNTIAKYTAPNIQDTYTLTKLTITKPSKPIELSILKTSPQEEELSILDELALSVQEGMDDTITGDEKIVTEALEVGDNWTVLTKEDELIETAKEFLGIKYIWAANGPTAFDCSGYTKYVFKKHGITIPRHSGNQAKIGMKVQYNELEKGDLVFFDTGKHSKSKKKVNHVGIYLGNNKFIHASSGGKKVMITSFKQKKFYKNQFMHGQRIINSSGNVALLSK